MTFTEYLYRLRAHRLTRVDAEYDMHLTAWLHHRAGATKTQGKKTIAAYKSFKDFFDYEKRLKDIDKPEPKGLSDQHKRMAQMAAQVNSK